MRMIAPIQQCLQESEAVSRIAALRGWFAAVYDLEAEGWLWTEYVFDAEGKRLISHAQGINADEILCYEYQPLPTPEN